MPDALTESEAGRLASLRWRGLAGARKRAAILTLLDTGVRSGELVALDWSDVDLKAGTVRVRTIKRTDGHVRTLPLSDRARDALSQWREKSGGGGGPAVFHSSTGRRWDTRRVREAVDHAARRADLEGCHPHMLRATFATLMYRRGVRAFVLQELLGHSSVEVTRRYCTVSRDDMAVVRHLLG